MNLTQITIGGPCKMSCAGSVIYFEDALTITPQPVWRGIPSSVGGEHDDVLVDLIYKITGRPKAVWDSTYRGILLPATLHSFTNTGGLVCGTSNTALTITAVDANGFTFTRGILTKMPEVFLGLGAPLYGEAEWTAFVGQGKALTDADAFYALNTTAWSQSDYPTAHQEQLCTMAWGAVTGWDTVYAETGFKLSHESKLRAVKQGNVTVDYVVQGYRGMLSFMPQEPTTAQLKSALNFDNTGGGPGTRRSTNAADAVVTGSGISVTLKKAGVRTGAFKFGNEMNRHGEFAMVSAATSPGTNLVFA